MRDDKTGISVELENRYVLLARCGAREARLGFELGFVEGNRAFVVELPARLTWQPDGAMATPREREAVRRLIEEMFGEGDPKASFVESL